MAGTRHDNLPPPLPPTQPPTSTPASLTAPLKQVSLIIRFAFTPCSILPSHHPQHNTATSHNAARPCQVPAWRGRRGGRQRRRPRHQGPKHGRAASFFQVSGGPAGVITLQGVLASVSRCLSFKPWQARGPDAFPPSPSTPPHHTGLRLFPSTAASMAPARHRYVSFSFHHHAVPCRVYVLMMMPSVYFVPEASGNVPRSNMLVSHPHPFLLALSKPSTSPSPPPSLSPRKPGATSPSSAGKATPASAREPRPPKC